MAYVKKQYGYNDYFTPDDANNMIEGIEEAMESTPDDVACVVLEGTQQVINNPVNADYATRALKSANGLNIDDTFSAINDTLSEKISLKNGNYTNQLVTLGKGYAGRAYGSIFLPDADKYNITLTSVAIWDGGTTSKNVTAMYSVDNRKFSVNITGNSSTTSHVGQVAWVEFTVSRK